MRRSGGACHLRPSRTVPVPTSGILFAGGGWKCTRGVMRLCLHSSGAEDLTDVFDLLDNFPPPAHGELISGTKVKIEGTRAWGTVSLSVRTGAGLGYG